MQTDTNNRSLNASEIRFGGAYLDNRRRALVDEAGRKSELRSKTYDVLALLMERVDSVVSKDDLFEIVWNGAAVSEDTLVQCITEIRKAIGAKGREALKTVTKVGYRLIPDAREVQASLTIVAVAKPIHQRGIAVLPFANQSEDKSQDFLALGLTEDVITDLSGFPDLFVIARNSSSSFKDKNLDILEIARDLGVRYLVEGSVRKSGERLRITVKLIDAMIDGSQLWAERYDRNYKDVFDIQDDIARQVVIAIVGKLTSVQLHSRQRPLNMEVYELSLRARELWTKSKADCDEAILLLTRAITLDPTYARTHCQLATAHTFNWIQWMQKGDSHMVQAMNNASLAVKLDPHDPVNRATYGFVLLNAKRWDEAFIEIDAALAMNSNGAHAYALKAYLFAAVGDGKSGLDFMDHALKLNPHPPNWYYFQIGFCQLVSGQYSECVLTMSRPEFKRGAFRRTLVAALELDGKHEQACKEAQFYMAYDPEFRAASWVQRLPYRDKELQLLHQSALVRAGIPE
jgi:TolB-like protein